MHYLLMYDISTDYLERRALFRAEHLKHAWASADRGELQLAGALADPVDSALLLFECESAEVPEAFAKADPYVKEGVVTRWRVRAWTTVVGERASTPLR